MEVALDAGADDVKDGGETWDIECDPHVFEPVKEALKQAGLATTHAEIAMVPGNRVHLDADKAESMLKLMNALEDNDDVQNVWANFDIDDDVLERLTA
jgi:transcriptional/translational regulatory protein YebC/TACO1